MNDFLGGPLENPFSDEGPEVWLSASRIHDEALARMHFLIDGHQACGVVMGPAGSGKTRLFRRCAAESRRNGRQVHIVDLSGLNAVRLLVRLDAVLGLNGGVPADSLATWDAVMNAVSGADQARLGLVLMLDHAQHAHADVWPLIDQLQSHGAGGLTLLIASPFPCTGLLADFARRHAALRIELDRLSLRETAGFIRSAFERIGVDGTPFDSGAIRRVHELTHGEPRLVSRLCRMTMLAAAADGLPEIQAPLVEAAAEEILFVAS